MKISIKLITLVLFSFVLTAFANKLIKLEQKVVLELKPLPVLIQTVELETPTLDETPLFYAKTHTSFLNALGHRESGNRYDIINTYGYMGKYQFGRSTLNGLGYKNVSNEEFLSNPLLQEEAMQKLLKHNRKKLRKQIRKYCGKVVNGVYVTESGILAAAHLAGQGNVKRFFRNGYEFRDGYGTKMTSYMSQFSDYQLNIYN